MQTIALQAASPLINAGLNGALSGVDARGNGYPRTQGPAADIGSFEFAPAPGIPSAVILVLLLAGIDELSNPRLRAERPQRRRLLAALIGGRLVPRA